MDLNLNSFEPKFPSEKRIHLSKHHKKLKSFEEINTLKSSQNPLLEQINMEKTYKIGNYFIKKTIGSGNFGKVKLAIHIPTGEKVAIKIVEKSKMKENDDIIRLERELEMLSKLEFPNVIMVSEIFENKNGYYIVMDYCEGGELFNYIVKNKYLSEDESAFFYYQLINGLEYIHSLGIVHRDLKPENLLLTKDHLLKIIDFGLSNYYKPGQDKFLYTPCGSPCYASPEMINGNFYDGTKIDIWSSGIILYVMLCGYLPFEDKSNLKMYKKIVECKVDYPERLSEISVDLLKKIIVPDPKERISIKEIKKHPFYLKGKSLFDKEFTIFYLGKKINNFGEDDNVENNNDNKDNNKSNENINESKLNNKESSTKVTTNEEHIISISNDDKKINKTEINDKPLKQTKERNIKNNNKEISSFNKTFDNTDKKNKNNLVNLIKEENNKVLNTNINEEFFNKANLNSINKNIEKRNDKRKIKINALNLTKIKTNKLYIKNLITNLNLSSLHKEENKTIDKIKPILTTLESKSVEKKPSSLHKCNLKRRNETKISQSLNNSKNKFLSNFCSKIMKNPSTQSKSKAMKISEKKGKITEYNTKRKNNFDNKNTFYLKKYSKLNPNNFVKINKSSKLKNYYSQIKTIDTNDISENKANISLKPITTKGKLNYFNSIRFILNSNNINNIINKYINNIEKKNNNLSLEINNYLTVQNSKERENIQKLNKNSIQRKQHTDLIDKYNLNNFVNINDINKKIKNKAEKNKLNIFNSENLLNKKKLFFNNASKDKLPTKISNNNFNQKILIYNNYIYNTEEKKLSKNKKYDKDKDNLSLSKYASSTVQTWIIPKNHINKTIKNVQKMKYSKTLYKEKLNRKKFSTNASKSILSSDVSNNTILRNAFQNNKKKIIKLNDSKKSRIKLNKKEINNDDNFSIKNKKMKNIFITDSKFNNFMNNKNLITSKNNRLKNNFFKQNTFEAHFYSNKTTNGENTSLLNKRLKINKINNKSTQNNMISNNKKSNIEPYKNRNVCNNKT